MKRRPDYGMGIVLLLALCVSIAGCQPQASNNDGVPVDIIGIDHLADHLSVQEFSVNGRGAFQAGKGGSNVCCATLPYQWRPGLTVTVRWNVTNWRDCKGEEHKAIVPVEKYDEVGNLWVHFLADGRVRVVSSNYGAAAANVPGSLHPVKDPIPAKYPWKVYPPHTHCKGSFE
jgi:hypothetical protein